MKIMHTRLACLTLLLIALFHAGCGTARADDAALRVLFVGNSLTYVGNLPAVLDAMAAANGKKTVSTMRATGGATLAQHVEEGDIERQLRQSPPDHVVLQERGGDIICSFGPQSCIDARESLATLAALARTAGAAPVYLGTYQPLERVSDALVSAEYAAAQTHGIAHVPVSTLFRSATAALPHADWFADDGMHPGADLTLLKAALVYRHLFGTLPAAIPFTVEARMRGPNSEGAERRTYTEARLTDVLAHIAQAPR